MAGAPGASAVPAGYEGLLARCWNVLHAVRPAVNVIAASAPHGNDPAVSKAPSSSPGAWYHGRRGLPGKPPEAGTERPWTQHASSSVGEGDYGKLMAVVQEAPGGTAQLLPGEGPVSIWYMERASRVPGSARSSTSS